MSAVVEVKYFNSFILRKAISEDTASTPDGNAVWAGDPSNPQYYPSFPIEASADPSVVPYDWFVEESRIQSSIVGAEVDLGVRAYVDSDDVAYERVKSGIIFSGIFNSRTGVNQSNVFSISEDITKELDPRYGGVEWMYADESNLLIFQESKIARALIDKDAVYTSEGRPIESRSDEVIGDIQYYSGDYGISQNPESFAVDGNRKYFSDVNNGAMIRLSMDGVTEISSYGMSDFFRDEFSRLSSQFKRFAIDVEWEIPWGSTTSTITVSGDNVSQIDIGMAVEGIVGYPTLYVQDIGSIVSDTVTITLSESISISGGLQPTAISMVKYVKDKVVGGYDDNYDNYVVSIVYNPPSRSSEFEFQSIDSEFVLDPTP